jgi:hypothetical protein
MRRSRGRFYRQSGASDIRWFYFGIVLPIARLAEFIIIVLVGILFLVAITRAFRAVRRRDAVRHREWMLRAFGVMVAVPATRVMGAVLDVAFAPTGNSSARLFVIDLWVTWALVIALTEWWIRHTRSAARAAFVEGAYWPPIVALGA